MNSHTETADFCGQSNQTDQIRFLLWQLQEIVPKLHRW